MTNILLFLSFILLFFYFKKNNKNKKNKYSQTDVHTAVKAVINIKSAYNKHTQLNEHKNKNKKEVIIMDDETAYWVSDNIFYTAKTDMGKVIHETISPVDTENMSKKELDKMLFILDNLSRGKTNDSGGSRN